MRDGIPLRRAYQLRRPRRSGSRITLAAIHPRPFYGRVQQFEKMILRTARDVIDCEISPHILRHTFSHWCDQAGIPNSRGDAYMGHVIRSVPQEYRSYAVNEHLIEDREKLRTYIEGKLTTSVPVMMGGAVLKTLEVGQLTKPGDLPALCFTKRKDD